MATFPLVSVVMPAHNAADFLTESITSVRHQSYRYWELLIIDDASTDATFPLAERYQQLDDRIKIIRLTANQGAGIARNLGIQAATGNYIAFLDADDLWLPKKLETQLRFMQQFKVKVCYSSYNLIDEKGKNLSRKVQALQYLDPQRILKANYIGNLTGIYHSKSLGKIYCSAHRKRQDWYLWIQAVHRAGYAMGIEESLAMYRIRKQSLSRNKVEILPFNYRIFREAMGFSSFKSGQYFLRFLLEHLFVKSRQQVSLKRGSMNSMGKR